MSVYSRIQGIGEKADEKELGNGCQSRSYQLYCSFLILLHRNTHVCSPLKAWMPEVGVSPTCASHEEVSSLNLQVSSKSQVTVVRVKQVKSSQVKSLLRSSKSSQVIQNSDE